VPRYLETACVPSVPARVRQAAILLGATLKNRLIPNARKAPWMLVDLFAVLLPQIRTHIVERRVKADHGEPLIRSGL